MTDQQAEDTNLADPTDEEPIESGVTEEPETDQPEETPEG